MRRALLAAFAFLLSSSLASAQTKTVEPKEVRKVVADGKHNAFTAMRRFNGHLFLAFRKGDGHNSGQADIVVLRSKDGVKWAENVRLSAGNDDRDPQFLIVGKKLFMYDCVTTGKDRITYAVFTEDGDKWSKPQQVYKTDFIVWKPTEFKGKYYSGAHKLDNTNGGKNRDVHLIVSDDGLNWEKISQIRGGSWESETTLYFDAKGHATAFLRQKYGSPRCQILEADAPYTTWKARTPNINHMSGHSVHTFNGVTYFLSRTTDGKGTGTTIYTFDDGKLTPYCVLPAGGDCSYADAVQDGDNMLVSYYSSHEGPANIYLAVVPLKK